MSECKTVTLRTRPLKKGMLSFYLDYYPGYRDQETMKTIRHEGLNIYIYAVIGNEKYIIFGNKSTAISVTTMQHCKGIDLFDRSNSLFAGL